ncbi:hypothetical protein [Dokdonella immobilis]|uniref:Uncharacterized protein n=1 Tax=Dokdonella immobilis TaxID=578942 RepID=A0A1I4VF12_9GAMM|nr:hypothetical protein [Dokdonella immobilis]SFM99663.1 hypothetical protein SAMN05216289_10217 [Dokdonella immobilis]
MNPETVPTPRTLIRDVLMLQFKLLLDTLRDLALSPLTLAAAALDLLLSRFQPPRYFYAVLRLGERSEEWIDLWSAARGAESTDRENVDALLVRVEEVVRDPKTGARRARILKRWAERQVARARQQIRSPAGESDASDRQEGSGER